MKKLIYLLINISTLHVGNVGSQKSDLLRNFCHIWFCHMQESWQGWMTLLKACLYTLKETHAARDDQFLLLIAMYKL